MKKLRLFFIASLFTLLAITSCKKDDEVTPIPDILLDGESSFEIYDTLLILNGIELEEGLTGYWEVIENTDSYALNDSLDPKCQFEGKLLGEYKLRWTLSNGKEEKSADITIKIIGFTDSRDGEKYLAIRIGNQIWMVENLNATEYNNGAAIPKVTNANDWISLNTGAYCNYNNTESNATTYGRLYNWYAVNTGRLAPKGWHVPTDDEWTMVTEYLINNGYGFGGSGNKIAKSLASTSDWQDFGTEGTVGNDQLSNNASGFTALPGGYCARLDGMFYGINNRGHWWTTSEYNYTDAWDRNMYYNDYYLLAGSYNKAGGLSVRCVKD